MHSILNCVSEEHDQRLITLAVLVCILGVYASNSIGAHARRTKDGGRRFWAWISIVAAGCTAWATHFVALLAFRPGVEAAFEPVLTIVSLLVGVAVIGAGVLLAIRSHSWRGRFAAGMVIDSGVALLHYLGQSAYLVIGEVHWEYKLIACSILLSLPLAGGATVMTGLRNRHLRALGAPLFILSIGVLHFSGMAAATITFDPTRSFPRDAVSPAIVGPLVASVSIGLLLLAVAGMRFSLMAARRLRRERERLRQLADVALEGLLICDGDEVIAANRSFARVSGYDRDRSPKQYASSLLPGIDLPSLPEFEEREADLVGADGQIVPVRVLRSQVQLGRKSQTVLAIRDQRERIRTEAKIRTLAFNDALTGLPNRTRFHELLTLHVASLHDSSRSYAVLIIDLDRFKPVNDMLGHAAGDLLLCKVAERLRSAMRDGDVIARLGGDEFVVLLTEAEHAESAVGTATRLIELLSHPFSLDGHLAHVGASVGVALAPEHGDTPDELLHNADLALYAAKRDGRGSAKLFERAFDTRMRERLALEAGLRRALAEGELVLHYQPLLDTHSGRIASAEALVRWRHPERGLIPPLDFITLAEETGLIVPLGEWVLRTACTEAATWPNELSVAVNLSPTQFRDPHLAETVEAALKAARLSPMRLELEITEGVLLADEERTLATLNALRSMGVRIAMDDFGTGYSSLSYLQRFPFDKIKIDQSFVRRIPDDPSSAALVRAIITMGACLGISTTVEGVETEEQLDFSTAQGCDHIQGYHVSRPLPATAFHAFLQAQILTHENARHLKAVA